MTVDGQFGTSTQAAVVAPPGGSRPTRHGRGERPDVAFSLTPNLSMGSSGDAVRALQRLLNDKRRAGLTVSGTYGTATRDAVAAFQRHMTSHARPGRWTRSPGGGCSGISSAPCGAARAGCATTAPATARRTGEPAPRSASCARPRSTSTTPATAGWRSGTSGLEHGGDIPGHETHEQGLDVDLSTDARRARTSADGRRTTGSGERTTGQRRGP